MWQAISQQLSEVLMFEFPIMEKVKLDGGNISECYMISDGEQRYFIKINDTEFLPHFEAEAFCLQKLKQTASISVPELVHVGKCKQHAFIILNYHVTKPLDNEKSHYAFGVQLANLHLADEQKEYGFDQDNYIGATLQPNQWSRKWSRFFSEQRIGWQLQLLAEKGVRLGDINEIVQLISNKLKNHNPKPSLLHGDLWFGNVANAAFGPITYDPACYWGDRECDLAMTELFNGFQPAFYQGYNSTFPIEPEYQDRKMIYNFYHILNHCNLFGGHYLSDAEEMLNQLYR